jgi:Spy/CpxP family protein refolding chaperone
MKPSKTNAPFKWFAAILLLAAAAASTYAQGGDTQTPAANPNQTQNAAQTAAPQNVPAALGFSPQQTEQWRQINREFRTQEVAAAAKVRDARLALNEAIESPNHNEEMIKQRARELADAQSAVTQLQALRQSRVLQILTPEQRAKLKQLREERARDARRQQQQVNGFDQPQRLRRNANAQNLTPAQRKALRQQPPPKQKP